MVGITAYGAYVPLHRLGQETTGWGRQQEKAVANYDEDSITMAAAAVIDCLNGLDRHAVDGLYFATTTSTYKEKLAATIVAAASDLRPQVSTVDFAGSLRAGTIALTAAIDAIKAGSAKQAMVAASDLRIARPRSELELSFGDGAAALMVGDSEVAVIIESSYSISDEMFDVWRADGDVFIRSWEDRFIMDEGYFRVLSEAVSQLLNRQNLTPGDITKAVFYAPDVRRHGEMARRLGFDPKTQVQDPMFATMGNTGTAFALMMLVAALEEAKPGDRILFANYGNGADAFILRVTDKINNLRDKGGIRGHLHSKKVIGDYQTYARWRGLIDIEPPARRPPMRTPSPSALWRERDKNIRFYGTKCKQCGYPQYPPQRVCTRCHAKDECEDYRFSDKKAEVFTYSIDYLGPTLDPPLIIPIIDFEGGGRVMCMMTDAEADKVKVGLPVEMSFRKLFSSEGIHNYYWKCMPVRT